MISAREKAGGKKSVSEFEKGWERAREAGEGARELDTERDGRRQQGIGVDREACGQGKRVG